MNEQTQNTWVYGVVPAGASLEEIERRSDHLPEVWVVEMGDLAAIVGEAPENDGKQIRDQALGHAQVLEAAAADATVIPMRFGTIVPGGDEAVGSDLLEARGGEIKRLLDKLKDQVQMTVKAYYEEQVLLREIIESEPQIAQLREATRRGSEVETRDAKVQLGELLNTAVQQRRERDASDILEQLKPISTAATVEEIEKEYMILNAPFLVARDRLEEFEENVEKLAEERRERMHFVLLGPMPAYNFLDVEEPAWA
jgi:hypothetical protein